MSLVRACDACGSHTSVERYYLNTNVKRGKGESWTTVGVKQGDLCAECLAKLPLPDKKATAA